MTVKCIRILIENPSVNLLKNGWWHAENYLTVGKEYEVYAIHSSFLSFGCAAFLVCDDNYNDKDYYWPLYFPSCFFEIIDNVKPSFWMISPEDPDYYGPPEIGPEYFEKLVDGDAAVLAAFRRIRNLLNDKGLPDNSK